MSRNHWRRRLTNTGTVVFAVMLAVSLCCSATTIAMPQHGCCKDRCAMAPMGIPLVAIEPVKQRVEKPFVLPAVLTHLTQSQPDWTPRTYVTATESRLFAPLDTIQLRI
ncbi:MAG: hypothetical protein M3P06_15565 [Acidobacteriota bacterium]|nr:hypothetical protein [Acidobacteriota bacterium]